LSLPGFYGIVRRVECFFDVFVEHPLRTNQGVLSTFGSSCALPRNRNIPAGFSRLELRVIHSSCPFKFSRAYLSTKSVQSWQAVHSGLLLQWTGLEMSRALASTPSIRPNGERLWRAEAAIC
jgi:hypothetical protein